MELRLKLGDDRSSGRLKGVLERLGYGGLALSGEMWRTRIGEEDTAEESVSTAAVGSILSPAADKHALYQLVLNQKADYVLSHSLDELEQRLHAAGLNARLTPLNPSSSDSPAYLRRFVIRVFHLRAIDIVPCGWAERALSQTRETAEPSPYNPCTDNYSRHRLQLQALISPLHRKLERTAVRALYALGLDFGEIRLSAGSTGIVIEAISPVPELEDESTARRFAEVVVEEYKRLKHSSQGAIMLGMDPEFLLYNRSEGKVVPASRYLERAGLAGCDAIRRGDRTLFPIAELRPAPAGDPSGAVRNLMGALQWASRNINDASIEWLAGGMPVAGIPLGGHLHFSGLPLTVDLIRSLDNYLALPTSLLEDARAAARRPKYGYLGDYRLQNHGGFEYRTLPSFLVSPGVTKGVVALAAMIARNYERLPSRPLSLTNSHHAYYNGDKSMLRSAYEPLTEELCKLPDYSAYENYIGPLLDAVRSGRLWDEDRDIRTVWKIAGLS